ncbi:hypothetical protein MC885_009268, partial [Smutsia gigantea]
ARRFRGPLPGRGCWGRLPCVQDPRVPCPFPLRPRPLSGEGCSRGQAEEGACGTRTAAGRGELRVRAAPSSPGPRQEARQLAARPKRFRARRPPPQPPRSPAGPRALLRAWAGGKARTCRAEEGGEEEEVTGAVILLDLAGCLA